MNRQPAFAWPRSYTCGLSAPTTCPAQLFAVNQFNGRDIRRASSTSSHRRLFIIFYVDGSLRILRKTLAAVLVKSFHHIPLDKRPLQFSVFEQSLAS